MYDVYAYACQNKHGYMSIIRILPHLYGTHVCMPACTRNIKLHDNIAYVSRTAI